MKYGVEILFTILYLKNDRSKSSWPYDLDGGSLYPESRLCHIVRKQLFLNNNTSNNNNKTANNNNNNNNYNCISRASFHAKHAQLR